MEIDAAPKLSKYMTALGAYNVKSKRLETLFKEMGFQSLSK